MTQEGSNDLQPGDAVDRYRLLLRLARGGMADVWLGRLESEFGVETLFAVKTIRADLSDDPQFRIMLADEAKIACRIVHPNVARIIELGQSRGHPYLVMEWVDGDSVATLLQAANRPIPVPLCLRIAADACAGLHAAHEVRDDQGVHRGVVHRDVSPNNVLIDLYGCVKVIDFGVARATDRLANETTTGHVKGTMRFMSPEQAFSRSLDRRSDLWSLGAVLYWMLAGAHPFGSDNAFESLRRLMNGGAPDPLPDEIPDVVKNIVDHALRHEPQERFATAAAMREALEEALAKLGGATPQELAEFAGSVLEDVRADRAARIAEARRGPDVRGSDERVGMPAKQGNTRKLSAVSESGSVKAEILDGETPSKRQRRRTRTIAAGVGATVLVLALIGGWRLQEPKISAGVSGVASTVDASEPLPVAAPEPTLSTPAASSPPTPAGLLPTVARPAERDKKATQPSNSNARVQQDAGTTPKPEPTWVKNYGF